MGLTGIAPLGKRRAEAAFAASAGPLYRLLSNVMDRLVVHAHICPKISQVGRKIGRAGSNSPSRRLADV
jgi:hypothetical protein